MSLVLSLVCVSVRAHLCKPEVEIGERCVATLCEASQSGASQGAELKSPAAGNARARAFTSCLPFDARGRQGLLLHDTLLEKEPEVFSTRGSASMMHGMMCDIHTMILIDLGGMTLKVGAIDSGRGSLVRNWMP